MVICPISVVEETLAHLKLAGGSDRECIVLWLARREVDRVRILEARRPEQTARRDRFRIPPVEMTKLRAHLRQNRLLIAAQVHSHPAEAFHSAADDEGAIIRHVGALSFVVPWFARQVTSSSFMLDVALYELQEGNRWVEIPSGTREAKCQLFP
jgi:proteasome lid subunit RPN8/RPN11